jgi:hypothetical protein
MSASPSTRTLSAAQRRALLASSSFLRSSRSGSVPYSMSGASSRGALALVTRQLFASFPYRLQTRSQRYSARGLSVAGFHGCLSGSSASRTAACVRSSAFCLFLVSVGVRPTHRAAALRLGYPDPGPGPFAFFAASAPSNASRSASSSTMRMWLLSASAMSANIGQSVVRPKLSGARTLTLV